MNKRQPFHYSTYARAVISSLKSLANLIRKYSMPHRDSPESSFPFANLLTLKQIEEALLNPQSTLKPSMAAFATLLKLHRDVISTIAQAANQKKLIQEAIKKLRDTASEAQEPQKEEIYESLKNLEESFKEVAATHQHLLTLEPQLDAFKNKITELTTEHDQTWEVYRMQNLNEIAQDLAAGGVELSETEQQELLTQETWPEILLRFQTLGLQIPTYLNLDKPNFTTYFKLKAYLAAHSSLSRRMLPHKPEDIIKSLKKVMRG